MKVKKIVTLLLLLCMVLSSISTAFAGNDWYTYTYNYWGDEVESPDAYSVNDVLYGTDFGEDVGHFNSPEGLFVIDDSVFVCDTGKNRIVELRKVDGEYELVRVIYNVQVSVDLAEKLKVGEAITLTMNQPLDIFVMPITDEERIETFGEYLGELYVEPEVTPEPEGGEESEGTEEGTEDDAVEGDGTTEDATTEENETVEGDEATSSSESEDATVEDGATEEEGAEDGATEGEGAEDGTTEGDGTEGDGTEEEGTEETPAPVEKKENVIAQELNLPYDFYICDTQNNRIIHCDYNLNVIDVIKDPKDDTLSESYKFQPMKAVADSAFRVYVQANGINSGLMEFDKVGTFTGYIGANKVEITIGQKIWRKLQTKEQRDRSVQYVPTEYNNLSLDAKGFIYVTTSTIPDDDINQGTATPVRKLNSMGSDILIRNGNYYPLGDLTWGTVENITGPSKFIDVIAFENETYCCLDRIRGRIFTYDFQGNMLYVFGNYGSNAGNFTYPTAMDNLNEETILVLDKSGILTEFSMTDYGRMVNNALQLYKIGDYDGSAEVWREVLKFNGNYELAYVGIGRALLRKGQYKEAMDCFEVARDDVNYSKAFKYYREELVEKYILYAVIALAVLIIVPKVVKGILKLRKEIKEA